VGLVIAGEGEERANLVKLAGNLKVQDRVFFVGQVQGKEKTYLLQNALSTLVPSRLSEAFSLATLESYAAGTPVIAARLPGLADLVQPGRTGQLVAPDEPEDLALALQESFANPDLQGQWGKQARQVAQAYSWPAVARRHLDLYEELLAAPPVQPRGRFPIARRMSRSASRFFWSSRLS
jgi:glycosyltransferase involved in cell wall biosynthesis